MRRDLDVAEHQEAVSHKEKGLLIDIYNVRKFSDKCKKAYEFFQMENEGIVQVSNQHMEMLDSQMKGIAI